ncbi:MAG TPA: SH3 domain-containing protein [Xanthobacteraceae bacterium]|nr:SH3 domain-containing protein [Xanthobacteraceae bacterium]
MTLRTKLLGAGAALLLSTGAALAVPATAQTDLNVRSGPGTQYPVVGSIQGGETVDARGCTGGWCRVSFSGGTGWASRSYLAMGGAVAPGPAVAVAPYVYDDDYYDGYGYYDYGYSYGPSFGFYAGPRFGHRWRGHSGWRGGNWAGRPGRTVGTPPVVGGQNRTGFAGPPANWQRPGTGIGAGARVGAGSGFSGGARVGASAGFSGGAGFRGGAAAAPAARAGGGGGGAQPGFAGSIVRGR